MIIRIKKRFIWAINPYDSFECRLYVNDIPEKIGICCFQGINGFKYIAFDDRKGCTNKEFNNFDDAKHFILWSYMNGHYV